MPARSVASSSLLPSQISTSGSLISPSSLTISIPNDHFLSSTNSPNVIMISSPPSPSSVSTSTNIFKYPLPKRLVITLLCTAATFVSYLLRVVISIQILEMGDEFGWTDRQRGLALSAFFWGYIFSQIPGGWWSVRWGSKEVLGLGVFFFSIASILTPLLASWGVFFVLVARALGGLAGGVIFPGVTCALGRWLPAQERSRMNSIAHSGAFLGAMTSFSLTPWLSSVSFSSSPSPSPSLQSTSGDWRFPFYFYGLCGLCWCVGWFYLSANSPDTHKFIDPVELTYIQLHNSQVNKSSSSGSLPTTPTSLPSIPLKRILSQTPVWAIIVCHFCNNWNHYVLLSWLPTYLHKEFRIDSKHSGVFSVLPYALNLVISLSAGWLADKMIMRGNSITFVRKLFQTSAFLLAAFFMILLMSSETIHFSIFCICGALGAASLSSAGFLVSPLDVAPSQAGIILGISNTFATIPGILGVALVGWILEASIANPWSLVFGISVVFYGFGAVFCNLYLTGERIF